MTGGGAWPRTDLARAPRFCPDAEDLLGAASAPEPSAAMQTWGTANRMVLQSRPATSPTTDWNQGQRPAVTGRAEHSPGFFVTADFAPSTPSSATLLIPKIRAAQSATLPGSPRRVPEPGSREVSPSGPGDQRRKRVLFALCRGVSPAPVQPVPDACVPGPDPPGRLAAVSGEQQPRRRRRGGSLSRKLSYVLRHNAGSLGLSLDEAGWVDVHALLAALAADGTPVSRTELEELVAGSDKQRFALDRSGDRIRAQQGHSVPVELGLSAQTPAPVLYHGTVARFLPSILRQGLTRQGRHHV